MKGGDRPGAGRPRSADPATVPVSGKLTPGQKKLWDERGGWRWVKRLLADGAGSAAKAPAVHTHTVDEPPGGQ